jgi:hypothetical protein
MRTDVENDMNENRDRRGLNPAWLLLIPAAVIIAKGARRRRAMWASGWGESGPASRGFGHHRGFGDREGGGDQRAVLRLPPKIERMLETWHTRAHEATGSTESPTSPDAAAV